MRILRYPINPIVDLVPIKNYSNIMGSRLTKQPRNWGMKRFITAILSIVLIFISQTGYSQPRFGESLCNTPDYVCMKITTDDAWEDLFPSPEERDIIKRVNRMNLSLKPGMTIAVPKNIDRLSIYDVSPFPRYIDAQGEKTIYVSQKQLAWGAYDEKGELIWWGPISSGSGLCGAADGHCLTQTGSFRIIRKQDVDCISTVFPRNADGSVGGAVMPFCMHYMNGFALHGSESVPGFRASHGCVRLFIEDARWLNEEFIDLPGGNIKGTRVIVDSIN